MRFLLEQLSPSDAATRRANALARELIEAMRRDRGQSTGVNALLNEFSLSSEEGVALMCLAEALLRIPDRQTADRFIADKIGNGDWDSHLGESRSLFVNAAAWGLLITGRLVRRTGTKGLTTALRRLVARGGEPLIRGGLDLAMRMLGRQFVTGETIEDALDTSRANRGYRYSYDMLGEAALTAAAADAHYSAYERAIHAIGKTVTSRDISEAAGISIKLSALHPRYARSQRTRVLSELLPRLARLALLARYYGMGITIDAEEADRLEVSLDLLEGLAFDPELSGYAGIGFVVQAYQKRAPHVIDYLIELAHRSGMKFMVRLVKGAYWDNEVKRAQVDGLAGYSVYTRKAYTDLSYLACARRLLEAGEVLYPQFATHNALTLATVFSWAGDQGIENYEFQCLHGMGEALYDLVVGESGLNKACRIYAPVGSHETLLPYLVRRLLENGANSSFINQIVDERVSIDVLLADPIRLSMAFGGASHPGIPLPRALFEPGRANSEGLDWSDESALRKIASAIGVFDSFLFEAGPLVCGAVNPGTTHPVINPADHADVVGSVADASPDAVETALSAAVAAEKDWGSTHPQERASMLLRAADLFEQDRPGLMALAIREAGKSLPNAAAEVREAVDFLRYYASRIRSAPAGIPLGAVVCISPWNFPLAIFVGQIGAALAAGNVVLAKPAEQTPLIAYRALRLLREAGIPAQALQLLPGAGDEVGAQLVADPRVKGVVFTGSSEVAATIHRVLARRSTVMEREIPLIAETGGLNAMIVDSTALPEQVVQDVITSAFDSAGQRCSSLRMLCLQEDIADRVLAMLRGAMTELRIGNPGRLDTDVGPVIDEASRANLERHVAAMKARGSRLFQLPLPEAHARGTYFPPTVVEIGAPSELTDEVFGPVLHVCRFARDELPQLLAAINGTGYGLTLGVQSRIGETVDYVIEHARVGNVYVNRNMVGAVVGVQPFGGERKSGTGPKAGGPLYLERLQQFSGAQFRFQGLIQDEHGKAPRDTGGDLLRSLLDWAVKRGQPIADLIRTYIATTPVGAELLLPGPTGEENGLRFVPRGMALCVASGTDALMNQIAAALATDNRIAIAPASAQWIPQDLPDSVRTAVQPLGEPGPGKCDVIMIAVPSAGKLIEDLAAGPGAPIPAIRTSGLAPIPLWRLTIERAWCVNTAATGGNAALLALADEKRGSE